MVAAVRTHAFSELFDQESHSLLRGLDNGVQAAIKLGGVSRVGPIDLMRGTKVLGDAVGGLSFLEAGYGISALSESVQRKDSLREVSVKGAGVVADSTCFLDCLNRNGVIDAPKAMPVISGIGNVAGMYQWGSETAESVRALCHEHSPTAPQEVKLLSLERRTQWAKVIRNIALFALNLFSFIGLVYGSVVSSLVMLGISSVAVVASIAAFFFGKNVEAARNAPPIVI